MSKNPAALYDAVEKFLQGLAQDNATLPKTRKDAGALLTCVQQVKSSPGTYAPESSKTYITGILNRLGQIPAWNNGIAKETLRTCGFDPTDFNL